MIQAGESDGQVLDLYSSHRFTFDHVYDERATQAEVYEHTAKSAVMSALQGYNATIIAYGQTGTGKTYTMEGFTNEADRGIIPRSTEALFDWIETSGSKEARFLVRASYVQIYNEVISDLLKPERTNLVIREDKRKGVFVEALSEWVVRSPQEVYGLMARGAAERTTGATKLNELSSRSHALFVIVVEQTDNTSMEEVIAGGHASGGRQSVRIGKLNLVDLAGSERVRVTGATGRRLEETKRINQSLSALGNVIAALTDPRGRTHIPYRDSKLTRILEDSLGGNCKTTMMAMISPALEAFSESLSTLKFANRAKNIKNEAWVNEDLDQKALLRKYERELKALRAELTTKAHSVVDKHKLLEVEEQRRRAEADKLAAMNELEARSREYMAEKQAKRKLEERIAMMKSQLLVGGQKIEDTPAFQSAVQEEHERIRREYEDRVLELERERKTIDEDKVQVDRYKILLVKQRDIMIALTARLNERDASILALQEELDAYDTHQRMMEEALDQKTAMLIELQKGTMGGSSGGGSGGGGGGGADYSHHHHSDHHLQSARLAGRGGEVPTYLPAEQNATQVIFDRPGEGGPAQVLLTPSEKIRELQDLVKTLSTDQDAISQELEEVKAEKVSLEYLLREKLEKMVAAEVRERMEAHKKATGGGGGGGGAESQVSPRQVQHLQQQLDDYRRRLAESGDRVRTLNAEVLSLREAAATATVPSPKNPYPDHDSLVASHDTLLKERSAIKIILEKKIKALVDSIAAGPGENKSREVFTLQKLVSSTIAALKAQD